MIDCDRIRRIVASTVFLALASTAARAESTGDVTGLEQMIRSSGDLSLSVADAALLMSKTRGGNLAVSIALAPADPRRQLVAIEIEVPSEASFDRLDLILYSLDDQRRVVHYQTFGGLPITDDSAHVVRAAAVIESSVLPSSIRVLVRDRSGQHFGLTGLSPITPTSWWVIASPVTSARLAIFDSILDFELHLLDNLPSTRRSFATTEIIEIGGLITPSNSASLDHSCPHCRSRRVCTNFDATRHMCRWRFSGMDDDLAAFTSPERLTISIKDPHQRERDSTRSDVRISSSPNGHMRKELTAILTRFADSVDDRSSFQSLVSFDQRWAEHPKKDALELDLVTSRDQTRSGDYLPFALVRWRASQFYQSTGSAVLAERSMRNAIDLANHIRRNDTRSEAREQAALLLTEIAGNLFRRGRSPEADQLLEHALANPVKDHRILLAAAVNAEQMGAHQRAVDRLRRALALEPGHAETKLRLAINLIRIGHNGARQLLEDLSTTPSTPSWIAILATEELALAALRSHRLERAKQLIEGRFADRSSMILLSRYLEEVDDQATLSRQNESLLQELEQRRAAGPQDAVAPRSRYRQWPLTRADRSQLEAAIRSRRPTHAPRIASDSASSR